MADNWTDEELRVSVIAYRQMLDFQRRGEPYVKKQIYRDLAGRYGRSSGAFEYRMQNISFVYSTQGRTWVDGLLPAKNVGANVAERIEAILAEVEGLHLGALASLATKVASAKKALGTAPPEGNTTPATLTSATTQFVRDPQVIAWVLSEANGVCERCNQPAPFEKEDGTPFLEVHHIRRLADGGPDTVSNAVAICPNCHRELHYGKGKAEHSKALIRAVSRLVPS